MDECLICYKTTDILRPILNCKCNITLCYQCWFNSCKSYCPICEREELNNPRYCSICRDQKHLKDIEYCPFCIKICCNECEDTRKHKCNEFCFDDEKIELLYTFEDVIEKYKNICDKTIFWVLGKLQTSIGDIKITRDVNVDNRDIIMFIWETIDISIEEFRLKTKKFGMKRLYFSKMKTGIKQYEMHNKHVLKHIEGFINKLTNL